MRRLNYRGMRLFATLVNEALLHPVGLCDLGRLSQPFAAESWQAMVGRLAPLETPFGGLIDSPVMDFEIKVVLSWGKAGRPITFQNAVLFSFTGPG